MDQSRGGWDFFFLSLTPWGAWKVAPSSVVLGITRVHKDGGIGRRVRVWFSPVGLCVYYNNIIGQEIEGAANLYLV